MNDPRPADWEAALFKQALAFEDPARRAAFLEGACHGNAALRARLEALLAAHAQPETLPATQAEAARPTIKLDLADAPDEVIGQTIGCYKLLEKIGEGGCGVVYVAEQTEPVRRRVALEVIKLGTGWLSIAGFHSFAHLAAGADAGDPDGGLLRAADSCEHGRGTGRPYIRAARARDLSGTRVLFGHRLRNACLPVVTWLGLDVAELPGGWRSWKTSLPRRASAHWRCGPPSASTSR